MDKIIFECESVTPIFMYGADGKTPELRPASIKGLMRFWWRAINGDLSLDKLKKQEDEIFGNTDNKSSFSVKIPLSKKLQTEKINPLPHKKQGDKGYHTKNAFKTNQTFKIIFTGKNLELIENLFKLTTILGGFGQRSRRGFGSIKIKTINENEVLVLPTIIYHQSEINYPYIKSIQVGKTYKTFQDLLETIGRASHNNNCDELGSINPRLASPIYVSILKFGDNDYRPIITTLKNTKSNSDGKVLDFKKAIL
jgi:CRISPR-associated protein Cmr1